MSLSNDFSYLVARWALPTPLTGHVLRVADAWKAPEELHTRREKASEAQEPQYKLLHDAPLHSVTVRRQSWYEERSSRNARRRRPKGVKDSDTSHLSPEAAQQMQQAAAALRQHKGAIRRALATRVPRKVCWLWHQEAAFVCVCVCVCVCVWVGG